MTRSRSHTRSRRQEAILRRQSRERRWIFFLLTLTIFLSACGQPATSGATIRLAPIADLPQEIRETPPEVRDSYRFALANHALLEAIPCYCGCGASPHDHRSNADCYIDEVGPAQVRFDQHAFT